MIPVINKKETGLKLRQIIDEKDFSVKDVQQYLGLGSIQSVYHWLNGISMPTIDNLYALSELFQMPIDEMICGTRKKCVYRPKTPQEKRLYAYYEELSKRVALNDTTSSMTNGRTSLTIISKKYLEMI